MSNNAFTGSEEQRFNQLQNFWLTFEPISDPDHAVLSNLYSVPLGQTKAPTIVVESGSVKSFTGSITIEKEIHLFADETEAFRFLTDLGPENIASYSEVEIEDAILGTSRLIEIHVINNPVINFDFKLLDADLDKGFIVEPFFSGSPLDPSGSRVDLDPVTREIIYNNREIIISDTYLRFFCIETDELPNRRSEDESEVVVSEFSDARRPEGDV